MAVNTLGSCPARAGENVGEGNHLEQAFGKINDNGYPFSASIFAKFSNSHINLACYIFHIRYT